MTYRELALAVLNEQGCTSEEISSAMAQADINDPAIISETLRQVPEQDVESLKAAIVEVLKTGHNKRLDDAHRIYAVQSAKYMLKN